MSSEIHGEIIKKAREELELTQLEVANKVGKNVNYYAQVERGEKVPSINTLIAIAKLLKIDPSDLISIK